MLDESIIEEKPRTRQSVWAIAWELLLPISWLGLVLLVAGCASWPTRSEIVCTAQNEEVLLEIESGRLDSCAPAVAQWERELARDCGWVVEADLVEDPR